MASLIPPSHLLVDRLAIVEQLVDRYQTDPDPGIHGAVAWTLRKWNEKEQIEKLDGELQETEQQLTERTADDRQWYMNTQGQKFVILNADTFRMGSPETEDDRESDEELRTRKIGRRVYPRTSGATGRS